MHKEIDFFIFIILLNLKKKHSNNVNKNYTT